MRQHNGKNARKKRREAAEVRNSAWASLTPKEQLAALDKRPGDSKRQRLRIKQAQEATKA